MQRLPLGDHDPTWPQPLGHGLALWRPRALFRPGLHQPPCPAIPPPTRGPATAVLNSLNFHPHSPHRAQHLPPNSSARNILGSTKTREGEAQAAPELRRAALSARPLPRWVSPPLPLPGNWRLRGVPRAESACLFKRPRGAPREPPGAGGGGRGRERLAPGGRGSTTKLRPLSLRIGRAPQTGGGRALSRPPPTPPAVQGPGVGRARASGLRPPASGAMHALRRL